MDIHKILGTEAHWNVNKAIAQKIGLNGALVLANLITLEKYFGKKGKLVKTKKGDGFFSQTSEKSIANLPIGKKALDSAIKELQKSDFIETCLAGIPAKKHFKINAKNVLNFLVKTDTQEQSEGETSLPPMVQTGCSPKEQTVCSPKAITINKEEKENKNKKKEIINNNSHELLQKDSFYYIFSKDFLDFQKQEQTPSVNYRIQKEGEEKIIEKWSDEIRKLHEIDGYSENQIRFVLDFIQQDEFWKNQIVSIPKLRKKNKDKVPYFVVMIDKIKQNFQKKTSKKEIIVN